MKTMSKSFTYVYTTAILTLFLCTGVVFATSLPETYDENELISYTSNDGGVYVRSGIILNQLNYDENGKLFAELKISNNACNITDWSYFSGYNEDYFYVPYTNQSSLVLLLFRQVINPSNTYSLRSFKCLNPIWSAPSYFEFCQYSYTDLGNANIRLYPTVLGSYSSPNGEYLTKTMIDNQFGQDFLENNYYFETISIHFMNGTTNGASYKSNAFYIIHSGLNEMTWDVAYNTFPVLEPAPPEPVDALCGLDNGQITNQEPPIPPKTLCQVGTASDVVFNGTSWTWTCYGENGGLDDSCISYNTEPVDALCGTYEGNYYDEPPTEPDEFCEQGTLIFPTFVETTLGWSWVCSGYNGGDNSYCYAYKNIGTLPELPEQDDCSLQDIPDRWFCEISNSLKSIFLPDADKINELQETINRINGRFPFNYLSVGRSNFLDLQENTDNDTITISLLDNEGTLNLEAVEPLAEKTKIFSQGLFIFGFLFWGIGYIKHFFK